MLRRVYTCLTVEGAAIVVIAPSHTIARDMADERLKDRGLRLQECDKLVEFNTYGVRVLSNE